MGRKDRDRFEKTGKVFRDGVLVAVTREVSDSDRERMQRVGNKSLQSMGTNKQVKVLHDSLLQGRLGQDKLRKEIETNAHKEMRKGADKLRKKGKVVTVDALLEEYRKETAFRELASKVGLGEEWFIDLAEKECSNEK